MFFSSRPAVRLLLPTHLFCVSKSVRNNQVWLLSASLLSRTFSSCCSFSSLCWCLVTRFHHQPSFSSPRPSRPSKVRRSLLSRLNTVFDSNKISLYLKTILCSFVSLFCSGLLSTPNLIPLPQQNQGSLLSAPTRMGLQAQVRNEAFRSAEKKNPLCSEEARRSSLFRPVRCSEISVWM